MSDSVRPYGRQPASLLCPWDSPARILEWVAEPSSKRSPHPGTEPAFVNVLHGQVDSLLLSLQGSPLEGALQVFVLGSLIHPLFSLSISPHLIAVVFPAFSIIWGSHVSLVPSRLTVRKDELSVITLRSNFCVGCAFEA